jgi:hypothetical protein
LCAPPLSSLVATVAAPNRRARRQDSAEISAADKATTVTCLLEALVGMPATVLITEPLPCSNADVPWSDSAVLYINAAGEPPAPQPPRDSLRALRRRIASLVRGGDGIGGPAAPVDAAAELDRAVTTARALHAVAAAQLEDACRRAGGAALAACLLRVVFVSGALQGATGASLLAENLLRQLATPAAAAHAEGAHGATWHRGTPAPSDTLLPEIPVIPVNTSAPTVTRIEVDPGTGAALPREPPVPETMRCAVAAAEGLGRPPLLALAQRSLALRRPLLAAFALQRLRQAARSADKTAWQEVVVEVLQGCGQAGGNAERPLEVTVVWLEALAWINDSRWRRLPPGEPPADAHRSSRALSSACLPAFPLACRRGRC